MVFSMFYQANQWVVSTLLRFLIFFFVAVFPFRPYSKTIHLFKCGFYSMQFMHSLCMCMCMYMKTRHLIQTDHIEVDGVDQCFYMYLYIYSTHGMVNIVVVLSLNDANSILYKLHGTNTRCIEPSIQRTNFMWYLAIFTAHLFFIIFLLANNFAIKKNDVNNLFALCRHYDLVFFWDFYTGTWTHYLDVIS